MSFLPLESEADLQHALEASYEKPVLIFKHSIACHVSASAHAALNQLSSPADPPVYRLVVQPARSLSGIIAQRFNVRHESPQLLVVADGTVQAHTSHYGVTAGWVRTQLEAA